MLRFKKFRLWEHKYPETSVYTSWILPSSVEINENKYYMLSTKDITERKE